jgi:hypothetical protein
MAEPPGRLPAGQPQRRGVRGRARLQGVDSDDLLSGPNLECEGAATAEDDGVGAVVERLERRHGAAATDPDQAGGEEAGWQLAGQARAGMVPGQRKSSSIQGIFKICYNRINSKFIRL